MASFLGSGSSYLDRTCAPIYDRFDSYDESDEDELRASTGSLVTDEHPFTGVQTLDEIGYSFARKGGLRLKNYHDAAPPVFKKLKVPHGTKIQPPSENECGICLLDFEPSELVTTDCNHQYCKECFAHYLHVQSGDISNIEHIESYMETNPDNGGLYLRIQKRFGVVCPHPLCNKIIEEAWFRNFADEATWERFLQFCMLRSVDNLVERGELIECPQRCGGYIQNCVCTTRECRNRTAARAKKAWERAQRQGAFLLQRWARLNMARLCPKCNIIIEKNGGCDHMFCIQCKTHYNWSTSPIIQKNVKPLSKD